MRAAEPAAGIASAWPLGLLLTFAALVHSAPSQDSGAVSVVDDRGRTVALARPPERIVTLLPSLTEAVCVLGACARLVGTDRYSNWPSHAAGLPKLGGLDDASLEGIVALRPDVVLASGSARTIGRLEELGIPVVALEAKTLDGARHELQVVARLLGEPPAADLAWQRVEAQIQSSAAGVPAAMRGERVYFEVSAAPHAASAGSFIGELLARLGLKNAVPASLGPFPKLNPEFVVRADPAVIMAAADDVAGMRDRPGWSGLTALRTGRICAFPGAEYDILVRPGPRLGEAADIITDCLKSLPNLEGNPWKSKHLP